VTVDRFGGQPPLAGLLRLAGKRRLSGDDQKAEFDKLIERSRAATRRDPDLGGLADRVDDLTVIRSIMPLPKMEKDIFCD
jgi:hypothetical protein